MFAYGDPNLNATRQGSIKAKSASPVGIRHNPKCASNRRPVQADVSRQCRQAAGHVRVHFDGHRHEGRVEVAVAPFQSQQQGKGIAVFHAAELAEAPANVLVSKDYPDHRKVGPAIRTDRHCSLHLHSNRKWIGFSPETEMEGESA